jgi:hypothetical protein
VQRRKKFRQLARSVFSVASVPAVVKLLPVRIAQISFDGKVIFETMELYASKFQSLGARQSVREWNRSHFAENHWRVIQENFVDHSGTEHRAVHRRSAFNHQAGNFQLSEAAQNRMNVRAAMRVSLNLFDADAARLQFMLFLFVRRRTGGRTENQNVILGALRNALYQARPQRQPKMGIKNHPQQRPTARLSAAIGEQRIIRQNSSNAGEYGVTFMALLLHVRARRCAGNPSTGWNASCWLLHGARRWSNLAIERHRGFQRNQRNGLPNVSGEGFVQTTGFCLQFSNFHLNPCLAQLLKAAAADARIRIGHRRDYAPDSGREQSVCAGGRSALMGVRFEIDVERSAAGFGAGMFKGANLGVFQSVVGVSAGSGDVAICIDDDRTNVRVRRGESDALARKVKRAPKKLLVADVAGHT